MPHSHPTPDSPDWDNPDYCLFCGARLEDGGVGFIDHVEEGGNETCRERFEEWRDNVAADVGGEWSG